MLRFVQLEKTAKLFGERLDRIEKIIEPLVADINDLKSKYEKYDYITNGTKEMLEKISDSHDLHDSIDHLRLDIHDLEQDLKQEFNNKIVEMASETKKTVSTIEDQLTKLTNEIASFNSKENDMEKTTDEIIEQKIFLNNLKIQKQKNLILANIPNSNSDVDETKMSEDHSKILELLKQVKMDQSNDFGLLSFFRIKNNSGSGNKSEFIKVIFKDKAYRDHFLKKSSSLKQSNTQWIRDVFCFPDLTKEDREKRKTLIEERNTRNRNLDANESKWAVRHLKLVKLQN